jgi:hypothetical protein
MDGLLRVAFVNCSKDTSVTVHIVTQDTVEASELLTTTPATLPEQNPGIAHPPGGWDLVVPPGAIIGFITKKPVQITNPNSAVVSTVYANGKDPWPQPPPPSTLAATVSDFDTRYRYFLMGGGLPDHKVKPIVMTLVPA